MICSVLTVFQTLTNWVFVFPACACAQNTGPVTAGVLIGSNAMMCVFVFATAVVFGLTTELKVRMATSTGGGSGSAQQPVAAPGQTALDRAVVAFACLYFLTIQK